MNVVPHTVRRSARARHVKVTVHPDRSVEVVLPHGVPDRQAPAAVRELMPWIEKRLKLLADIQVERTITPGHLPYLGLELPLKLEPGRKVANLVNGQIKAPELGAAVAVERLYRRLARDEINDRLGRFAAVVGVTVAGFSVRDQKTRWGSCSSSGQLSFNWRLMLAPEAVFEYVLWHELCHLIEPNHSQRYWAEVERVCPDFRQQKRWLSKYGSTLFLNI